MNLRHGIAWCAALFSTAAALPHALADTSATSRRTVPVTSSAPEPLPVPDSGDVESPPADDLPAPPIAEREEAWRYRYHLGRWWYYVERKHWLYWDGQSWQDARPQTPKVMPDGSVQRPGLARRALAAWPQVPSYREHHGWIGGFYSSGGGYGSSDFGYGYGIPSYGPGAPYVNGELSGPSRP